MSQNPDATRTVSGRSQLLPASGAVDAESRALFWAAIGLVLGAVVALIIFRDRPAPLSGSLSVGTVSAMVASALGLVAFGVSYGRATRQPHLAWRRELSRFVRGFDAVGLALLHVAIIFLGCILAFDVLQNAFKGLAFDGFSAGIVVGMAVAASTYFVSLGGANVTSYTLSTLLAVFLVGGGLISMSTAEDPLWWENNFSALGAGDAVSSWTFNLTMVISGVVITTLAEYITADLRRWATQQAGYRANGIRIIKWMLVVIGLLLVGVAVFPADKILILHNICATGMMLVFAGLIGGIRWMVPGFSGAFFTLSNIILGALLVAVLLFFPIGYFGLTALELVAAALVFIWLIVFVRNTGAALEDSDRVRGAPTTLV